MDFPEYYAQHAPGLIAALRTQAGVLSTESLRNAALHLLGRGKLYRPLLVLATAEAVGWEIPSDHYALAASVELVHTFTLIHDDLPCMDDADLRRGVPAVHRAYGEATAVLSGDVLLSLAFEGLAGQYVFPGPLTAMVAELARAVRLVIEGQMLDLQAEGSHLSRAELETMHGLKTGALLGCCCALGGLLGSAEHAVIEDLRALGHGIGLAFQIRDDLLSVQGTEAVVGKSLGTDVAKAKSTFPSLLGVAGAEQVLAEVHAANLVRIGALPLERPEFLEVMAGAALERSS